jgi:carboxyl-terminal processing protease
MGMSVSARSTAIGITIRETDERRSYVTFVLASGPADQAGIKVGAEILSINGRDTANHISRVIPWGETYSTEHNRRIGQARFATRFPDNMNEVEITYQNEGASEPKTVTLSSSSELDSFVASFDDTTATTGFELPLDYRLLDSGYGYVKIYSFLDNRVLTIQLWERLMQNLNERGVPGLIIDMRENGGGNGFLADQMTAYFFDEPLIVGSRGSYNREIDAFFFDPRSIQRMYLPTEELRYNGEIAVLIGANCASACERFSYNMTLKDRAAIIGHYPTAGLGGSVNDFRMPEGLTVRFTAGRSLDAEGNIHIESLGVSPTIDVPFTRETLFSDDDPILDTAVEYLDSRT